MAEDIFQTAFGAEASNIHDHQTPGIFATSIYIKCIIYSTSDQFREGTELMLNELINNGCSKVLADLREMILIGMEDQKWLETRFLPRAIKFGFKQIAIITPNAYFNKVAVESVSYKVDKEKLTISFFDSREEAVQWLNFTH